MDEMILIESETLRRRLCTNKNTDLLDRIGQLVELPGTAWATIENIADFYMVGIEAIKSIVKRHRKKLKKDGYKLLTRKEFEKVHVEPFQIPNRGITVFSRRAVLRIGMLLRHSQVAQLLRSYLLNIEQSQINNSDSLMKMANQLAQHSLLIGKNVEELGELAQMSINQSHIICAVVADVYKNRDKIQQVENDVNQCNSQVDFLHQRVATIEKKITISKSESYISKKQIQIIRDKVKSKKEISTKIWIKFRKHFGIARYVFLPKSKFVDAISWLDTNFK